MSNTTRSSTRRDRSAWEQLMAQYETGNISQRLFCEQHGIAYHGEFVLTVKTLYFATLGRDFENIKIVII